MTTVRVTMLFCIVLAGFSMMVMAFAEEQVGIDDLHDEIQGQLMHESLSDVSGAELADMLIEKLGTLTALERDIINQLREHHLAGQPGHELARMLRENEVLHLLTYGIDERGASASCTVTGLKAKCCAELSFKFIWETVRLSACVLAEIKEGESLHVAVYVLGIKRIEITVDIRNPAPICVGIRELKPMQTCVVFTELSIVSGKFHGCLYLQGKALFFEVFNIKLGCVDIP